VSIITGKCLLASASFMFYAYCMMNHRQKCPNCPESLTRPVFVVPQGGRIVECARCGLQVAEEESLETLFARPLKTTFETAGLHPLSINAPARQWGKKSFIDGITNALYGKTLWGGHLVAYAGVDRLDTDAETLRPGAVK
jgi:hypothetical protein